MTRGSGSSGSKYDLLRRILAVVFSLGAIGLLMAVYVLILLSSGR